eukprot:gnl/Chilomastix_cuspidata/4634.p1 GENE.gnl/Chilomastix_cuspidata/4634~~gnl/Chilomastix_cuspidata/4634.p1  ORF type:complete len:537 (+),score=211.14 gnl/Chilomastix_cuspidata/4634:222-1613(+)
MYNISLVSIADYFGVSETFAQWFVIIPSLVSALFNFFVPSIVARFSVRTVMIFALFVFGVGNLVMPWWNIYLCLALRAVSCVGHALANPLSAPLARILTRPQEVRDVLGMNSVLYGVSIIVGNLLSGYICESALAWRGIPLLIGALSIAVATVFCFMFPRIPRPAAAPLDVRGAVLLSLMMVSFQICFGCMSLFPLYATLACAAVGLALLLGFVLHYRALDSGHIIPRAALRDVALRCAFLAHFFIVCGSRALTVLVPLALQDVWGFDVSVIGLVVGLTSPVGMFVGGAFGPRLARVIAPLTLLVLTSFLVGLFECTIGASYLLESPGLCLTFLFLTPFCVSVLFPLNQGNMLLAANRETAPILGSCFSVLGAFGGGIGTAICVSAQDLLIPVFDNPSNPSSAIGKRMACFISSLLCATIVFLSTVMFLVSNCTARAPLVPAEDAERDEKAALLAESQATSSS